MRWIRTTLKLIIILLVPFILTNCSQTPQPAHLRTMSAQEFYPKALKIAQEWKPDAYLASIDVGFLPEEVYTKPLRMSFGFESPSDDHYSQLIYFREDKNEPEVKIIDHPNSISVRNPIAPEDWLIDSVQALAIAQSNGGNEFLAKLDAETALLFLRLEEQRPIVQGAPLQWRVIYSDIGTAEHIWIKLNPKTGEVIGIETQ